MEKRFERIHVSASVSFTDSSKAGLFGDLAKTDKCQIMTLRELTVSYGGTP
jgi:hypothetical protein